MLSAMYQETLLAHHRAPHNRRALPDATHRGARKNPLCGDAMELFVALNNERIDDVSFGGRGCSIAVASASMLTDVVTGMARREALALIDRVESMLHGGRSGPHGVDAEPLPIALDALRGVAPFPGRHGCATMPWLALRDALHERP
jgi:nitrogen fixation protein NifU and related proteins